MTLVVSAFTDWDNGHHMAGAEQAGWDLQGNEAVKRRGVTYLPRLTESDLWVTPTELEAFRRFRLRQLAQPRIRSIERIDTPVTLLMIGFHRALWFCLLVLVTCVAGMSGGNQDWSEYFRRSLGGNAVRALIFLPFVYWEIAGQAKVQDSQV